MVVGDGTYQVPVPVVELKVRRFIRPARQEDRWPHSPALELPFVPQGGTGQGGNGDGRGPLGARRKAVGDAGLVMVLEKAHQPGLIAPVSVQVVTDPVAAGYRVSQGSYGWDGAFGTHFWVDPKEKIVGVLMIQTDNPNRQLDRDFENAVMQAIVE